MKFDEQEEKDNDFFEREFVIEEKPKEPKPAEPRFSPDDPRYWDKEESEWEHLKPQKSRKILWWLILSLAVVGILVWAYIYFFTPQKEEAVEYGYVENIYKEGTLFKTFEGVILPYRELMDKSRVYDHDFIFTAKTPSVAADIKRMEKLHRPVRVTYNLYHVALPWRGKSKVVVTAVEPANPNELLPPELQPEYIPNGVPAKDENNTPQ